MARLLVARRVPPAVAARAAAEHDALLAEADLDAEAAIEAANRIGAEAILSGGKVRLTAAHVPRLPKTLRVIANPTAGVDHMDVAACRAAGIEVTNAPDAPTECTADLAFLHILAACRRARESVQVMEAGWRRAIGFGDMLGLRVWGRSLGIVGMGRIGRAVARRARGFGMQVHYHNRARLDPALEDGATYHPTLDGLLGAVEIVSLHLPGGGPTLMGAREFTLMRPGSVFVNLARGSLVDEDALLAALDSGHLFAVGLDVFRAEPAFDLRLRDNPRVFLTPHCASATVETRDTMGFCALDNIAAVLAGRPAPNPA